jgi:hypothetical protein
VRQTQVQRSVKKISSAETQRRRIAEDRILSTATPIDQGQPGIQAPRRRAIFGAKGDLPAALVKLSFAVAGELDEPFQQTK